MSKPLIFISYSHRDEEIKDRLISHLRVLENSGQAKLFDTSDIPVGAPWSEHIKEAIEKANVALLLVSSDYLASDFIIKNELPRLRERHESGELVMIPVIARPTMWTSIPWLRSFQAWPRDGRPISLESPTELDNELAGLAARVSEIIRATSGDKTLPPDIPTVKEKSTATIKESVFFISHDHSDGDFAELMKLRLEKEGYGAWIDLERLRVGEDWRQEIDKAIRSATALIVIMSPEARQSEYVTYEWAFAWGVGVPVIPILLKETPLHPRLASLQYLDFTNRAARPWDKLIEALKNAILKKTH
jgi:hypothetical protein